MVGLQFLIYCIKAGFEDYLNFISLIFTNFLFTEI